MEQNVVNWFEIPVDDMARAKQFYKGVLGYEAQDMPSPSGGEMAAFPWVQEGANATGALVKSEQTAPAAGGTLVYFTCDDCGAAADRAPQHGGKRLMPKIDIGDHGFIAHVLDSEGNKIGLHSRN